MGVMSRGMHPKIGDEHIRLDFNATYPAMINTFRREGRSSDLKNISGLGVGDFQENTVNSSGGCLIRFSV
jgi:hypothetical protein